MVFPLRCGDRALLWTPSTWYGQLSPAAIPCPAALRPRGNGWHQARRPWPVSSRMRLADSRKAFSTMVGGGGATEV
jgi:hypothetical protein